MAGLPILRSNYDTIVQSVDFGGPSDVIGIKKGDKILKIEGRVAAEIKMEEIRKMLKAGDGKDISVSIQHEGQIRPLVLRLKKEI